MFRYALCGYEKYDCRTKLELQFFLLEVHFFENYDSNFCNEECFPKRFGTYAVMTVACVTEQTHDIRVYGL